VKDCDPCYLPGGISNDRFVPSLTIRLRRVVSGQIKYKLDSSRQTGSLQVASLHGFPTAARLRPQTQNLPEGSEAARHGRRPACLRTNVSRRTRSELAEGDWVGYFRVLERGPGGRASLFEDHLSFAMKHPLDTGEEVRVSSVIRRVVVDAFHPEWELTRYYTP